MEMFRTGLTSTLTIISWFWTVAQAILVVQVHYDALYLPVSPGAFLRKISTPSVTSTKLCIWACTNDPDCQTAIHFYEAETCSLFSELCSVGRIQSSTQLQAHVICYQQPPTVQNGFSAAFTPAAENITTQVPSADPKVLLLPTEFYSLNISNCATWNQTGITVAGRANGNAGSDLSSLRYPTCLYIDKNGSLFITDQFNRRVMKYRVNETVGTIVAQNFTMGGSQYILSYPRGVAVDLYGFVIVTSDLSLYRILNFSTPSNATSLVQNNVAPPIGTLRDLHIDDQNNVYATDSDNSRILRVKQNGVLEFILPDSNSPFGSLISRPFGSFIDLDQNWYIANTGTGLVTKWRDGTLVSYFPTGGVQYPIAVVVSNNGNVFIAGSVNGKIWKLSENLSASPVCVVGCSGLKGNAANQLKTARDLKFDRHGNLYVVDQDNNRVQKFLIQTPSSCSQHG